MSQAHGPPAVQAAHRAARSRAAMVAVALVAITSAGAVLRFWGLGAQSFWFDETVTWNLVHRPLGSMLVHGIPGSESTPPLYYVLAWVWTRAVGSGEAALRSLSALAGTAAIPVAYFAARAFAGRRAALLTALLAAVSPILVWYSQEARAYALLGFLCALSLLFFARLLRGYGKGNLAAWSVVAVLALSTHYFALFLVIVEGVWLWRRLPRRPMLVALAPPAAACALLTPLAYVQRGNAGGLTAADSLGRRLGQTGQWFATGVLHGRALEAAVGLVALVALALLATGPPEWRRRGLAPLAIASATVLLPILLALAGRDYVFFRNLIPAWLPLAMAVAAGLTRGRSRTVAAAGAAGAVLLVGVFTFADLSVWWQKSLQRDNYRALAAVVPVLPQSALVVYPGWDTVPLQHYQPRLSAVRGREIRIRYLTFIGVTSDFSGWLSPRRVSPDTPVAFHLIDAYRVQHFVVRRYAASRPVRVSVPRLTRLMPSRSDTREPRLSVLIRRR